MNLIFASSVTMETMILRAEMESKALYACKFIQVFSRRDQHSALLVKSSKNFEYIIIIVALHICTIDHAKSEYRSSNLNAKRNRDGLGRTKQGGNITHRYENKFV